jgi:hypothetical protein
MFDVAANVEAPFIKIDRRMLPEIEHRPVLDFMLSHGKLRHAVTIRRTAPGGRLAAEPDIHTLVERNLPLDVLEPPRDQIRPVVSSHLNILDWTPGC